MRKERTRDSVVFIGSPRKHPYDAEKMLLIIDPTEKTVHFYEFLIQDIVYYEADRNNVTEDGRTIPMARIWVPKGALGIEYRPFEVADPIKRFSSFDRLNAVINGQ